MRIEALIRLASRLGLTVEITVSQWDKTQSGMVNIT
jgi:hypothetical protein